METTLEEIKLPQEVQDWIDENALTEGAGRVLSDQDDMTMDDAATLVMEETSYAVPPGVLVWEPYQDECREWIANRIKDESDNWRLMATTVARMTLFLCAKKEEP